MSGLLDPTTGQPLPNDAIQRILYICHPVHVYAIPPLMSMKGYTAADWTTPDPRTGKTLEIFTARLRIIETAIPINTTTTSTSQKGGGGGGEPQEHVRTDILLEDPSTGNLFAGAPYTDAGVVEHAVDSARFFAVRVVGEGKKAVLGIGFEDRSESFDFGIALQEARKILGITTPDHDNSPAPAAPRQQRGPMMVGSTGRGPRGPAAAAPASRGRMAGFLQRPSAAPEKPKVEKPKDYSLKPGQTISVDIGSMRNRRPDAGTLPEDSKSPDTVAREEQQALFSIAPPPGPGSSSSFRETEESGGGGGFLPPPPPPASRDSRGDRRRRPPSVVAEKKDACPVPAAFSDDDDFGDFQ